MRADRLVSLILLLQRRERVTAAKAAVTLEVSERTARRDLEALSAAGLPVYSERGRSGGWRLLGGGRTDLSGLTAAEARALFLVAGPSGATTPEVRAALRKLVQALPEPFRTGAETAAGSVVVDPGAWGETRRVPRPPMLEPLQTAAAESRQVLLGYLDRHRRATLRMVHPLGLALKGTVWYLLAGTDDGLRTFRVSRVTSVEITDEPATRPDGFDLAEAWAQVVERVDRLRSPVAVTAVADPDAIEILRWAFERQLDVGTPRHDGRVPLVIRGSRVEGIAAQLAGFGRLVEVLDPPEARLHLRRLGQELLSLYRR